MRNARLAVACFATGVIAVAQQEPAAPTFSAATRLVEVDVVARSNGAPAEALTKEDFTLFDNGKPRKIAFFSVRPAKTSAPVSGPAAAPLPAGAVSNRLERGGEASGSTTVLLIDQINTPPATQAFAIPRVRKFLQMRRGADRIGIYTYSADGLQAVQEITGDDELLSQAANSLNARDPKQRSRDTTGMTAHAAEGHSVLEITSRATDFKNVLEATARHLAKAPGRKNLIWITNSFPLYNLELGVDFRPDMEKAAHALNDANVALYAVDARGLIGALSGLTAISNAEIGGPRSPRELAIRMGRGESQNPAGLNTMQMLAGLTGGLVFFNNSNAIEDSVQAAMDDGELTYTLGFYPVREEQDGSWHNLKVAVDKPGVNVRYRKNYFASKTADVTDDRPTLEQLIRDPLDATQLELVAETTPDPARPGFRNARVTVDLHGVQLERRNDAWEGAVDVTFLIEGSQTGRTITTAVKIPDKLLAGALEKGIVVNSSIEADGQAGVLRIVARDRATGVADPSGFRWAGSKFEKISGGPSPSIASSGLHPIDPGVLSHKKVRTAGLNRPPASVRDSGSRRAWSDVAGTR